MAHTGGAEVVQNLVGTDLGVDRLDCSSHFDGYRRAAGPGEWRGRG